LTNGGGLPETDRTAHAASGTETKRIKATEGADCKTEPRPRSTSPHCRTASRRRPPPARVVSPLASRSPKFARGLLRDHSEVTTRAPPMKALRFLALRLLASILCLQVSDCDVGAGERGKLGRVGRCKKLSAFHQISVISLRNIRVLLIRVPPFTLIQ
jgi:hypothetical protein